MAVLALLGCDAAASRTAAQAAKAEARMSEDVRRMHEQLTALSQGRGSMPDLRVEFMEGGMASHRSFSLQTGSLVSKEWTAPGSPMLVREGKVTAGRVSRLLEQLIAKRYWTFAGTRFVPDAPVFLFRFYYGELNPVDFRCDGDELQRSPARVAIRDLFLTFASETDLQPAPGR